MRRNCFNNHAFNEENKNSQIFWKKTEESTFHNNVVVIFSYFIHFHLFYISSITMCTVFFIIVLQLHTLFTIITYFIYNNYVLYLQQWHVYFISIWYTLLKFLRAIAPERFYGFVLLSRFVCHHSSQNEW